MKNLLIKVGIIAQSLVGMRAGAEPGVPLPTAGDGDDDHGVKTEQRVQSQAPVEKANTYYVDALVPGADSAQAAVLGHAGGKDTTVLGRLTSDTLVSGALPLWHGVPDSLDVDTLTLETALQLARAPSIAPPHFTVPEKFTYYTTLLRRQGATPFESHGNKYAFHSVLLRGVNEHGIHHQTAINAYYDDVMVLLGKDGFVQEFRATSHPTMLVENSVTPEPHLEGGKVVGEGGVAMLDAGQTLELTAYTGAYGQSFRAFAWNGSNFVNRAPAHRNRVGVDSVNASHIMQYQGKLYDDVYSAGESASTAGDIALHAGGAALTNPHDPLSFGAVNIGCFNLTPADMAKYNELTHRVRHILSLFDANVAFPAQGP